MSQSSQPILQVVNLVKHYAAKRFATPVGDWPVLDRVTFSLFSGTTLAIVGESGSGKSTLAMCLSGLEEPTAGEIWFDGRNLVGMKAAAFRNMRHQIQLIFQDPTRSLNPKWSVFDILCEPLILQRRCARVELEQKVRRLLENVGLSREMGDRLAVDLSGGQRQRIAIARALALEPKVLILEEALSALDFSVQAQIANLLVDIQQSTGTAYIFITHDLAMGAHLAGEIAVMERGRIVEQGPAQTVLSRPQQEISQRLLATASRFPAFAGSESHT